MSASIPKFRKPHSYLINLLKDYLTQRDINRISYDVNRHYRILRLIDAKGNYTAFPLEAFGTQLSLAAISIGQVHAFLHQIGENIDTNPYLCKILRSIEWSRFLSFGQKSTG
jgi:hypothetical protein